MSRTVYECEKCHEQFELTDMTDILFVEHEGGGAKRQVSKIRVCRDCAEKAESVLAEALELPVWD